MRVMVTGGAGFIGSAVVRRLVATGHNVLNVDKLTYAGRLETVASVADSPCYGFARIDIADRGAIAEAIAEFDPDRVFHLAAESHVDRSIDQSVDFIETNIVGTHALLEAALTHMVRLESPRREAFRFVHVSTDEVFGSLGSQGRFTETSPYAPNSPYAASKAAADHLARAWWATYGLPVVVTNCSNNFGPWQHPEKLIPTIIRNALAGTPIPIYGTGANVRDWLHVEDHVEGLLLAGEKGIPGESYAFGGNAERTNLAVATAICDALDALAPRPAGLHAEAITLVDDRPGHDQRYAIDSRRARDALGWVPRRRFEDGLRETVMWYLDHPAWLERAEPELKRLGLGRNS